MNYWSKGVRTVAAFVAAKGLLGFAGGVFALSTVNSDMGELVAHLLNFTHLASDGVLARWLSAAADNVQSHRQGLACISFAWGSLKLVEGVGLWWEKIWAEWLVLISTAILFIPLEVWELAHKVTWLKVGALLVSIGVLVFMALVLYHNHKAKLERRALRTVSQGGPV